MLLRHLKRTVRNRQEPAAKIFISKFSKFLLKLFNDTFPNSTYGKFILFLKILIDGKSSVKCRKGFIRNRVR